MRMKEDHMKNGPLKPLCTKAKGNRQVHWNMIWEELKAKAKRTLEDEEKSAVYARRKVEVESVFVFGHIKGTFYYGAYWTAPSLFGWMWLTTVMRRQAPRVGSCLKLGLCVGIPFAASEQQEERRRQDDEQKNQSP